MLSSSRFISLRASFPSLIALSSSGFPVEGSSLGFSGAFASSFFSVPADPAAALPPWQMPFTSRNTAADTAASRAMAVLEYRGRNSPPSSHSAATA